MPSIIFLFIIIMLTVLSYGFIDPHLSTFLPNLASYNRPLFTVTFAVILMLMFSLYVYFLRHLPRIRIVILSATILLFSFPALTYDIFNYIATAKVAYTYHENPYVVMPADIPNEPNLVFTRAANKIALYGPVWIAITALPHYLGNGNIWQTILTFKILSTLVYVVFCYFIWKLTGNMTNVIFFALNPLVLIEVIMNGHNDLVMMLLALTGLKYRNYVAFIASWFIKGATVILTPLMFLKFTWDKTLVWTYSLLALIFFVIAPLREELYPWYAVWLVSCASLLSLKSHSRIYWFTIVLSFGLELRALPYMWMGYYEGPGPMLRTLLTIIPLGMFGVYLLWKHTKKSLA